MTGKPSHFYITLVGLVLPTKERLPSEKTISLNLHSDSAVFKQQKLSDFGASKAFLTYWVPLVGLRR